MQADRANRPRGEWGGRDSQGPGGQGRPNWQPGQRHGQQPPPAEGQAPPPAGPQSLMDGGTVGPPAPDEGAGGVE